MFLFGCNKGPTPQEEIYTVLEEVVVIEDAFKEQQNPLVELEKSEKELYDEIISLSMKEYDRIVTLSEQALGIVEERDSRIDHEYESLQNSKNEFQKVHELIEKLEEDTLKQEALSLVELMNNRYDSYEELYKSYKVAVSYDKELYKLFQQEDLSIEPLQEQINLINESYDQVIAANEKFNDYTENYNLAKITFYKNAGLDVTYK